MSVTFAWGAGGLSVPQKRPVCSHKKQVRSINRNTKLGNSFLFTDRVEGEEDIYEARVYEAEDDWEIEIKVDKENGDIKVFYLDDEDEGEPIKVPLEPIDLETFQVKYEGNQCKTTRIKDGLGITQSVVGIGNGLAGIISHCLPFCS